MSDKTFTEKDLMADQVLDQILAREDELVPSSGFLASVMERIEEEAAAPKPLAFPWKRALPGFALAAADFAWATVLLLRQGLPSLSNFETVPLSVPAWAMQPLQLAGMSALALTATWLSWLLARRLAGGDGLL